MKKRDFHKYLIALAVIYVVRDITHNLYTHQYSQGGRQREPLLEQQVNKKFNKEVRPGLQ